MEKFESMWIRVYASKIDNAAGDLGTLGLEERKHLKLLMRKFEIEEKSGVLNLEMSQTKMMV